LYRLPPGPVPPAFHGRVVPPLRRRHLLRPWLRALRQLRKWPARAGQEERRLHSVRHRLLDRRRSWRDRMRCVPDTVPYAVPDAEPDSEPDACSDGRPGPESHDLSHTCLHPWPVQEPFRHRLSARQRWRHAKRRLHRMRPWLLLEHLQCCRVHSVPGWLPLRHRGGRVQLVPGRPLPRPQAPPRPLAYWQRAELPRLQRLL
jgi:hypothetical protein